MAFVKFQSLRHPIARMKALHLHLLTKPHRHKIVAKVSRRLSRVAAPQQWVFIVGCYNSGTTLLSKIVSKHSQISRLDEGAFKTDQLLTPEELGWPRLWCQVVKDVKLEAKDRKVHVDNLKKDWSPFFDPTKPVFMEKSIVNSARMTWLQENFSNSYFLFIVRNGYAVAEGIRRQTFDERSARPRLKSRSGSPYPTDSPYPIELCAKQWLINNRTVEEDSAKLKHFKPIFYETLCKRPKETIADVYSFLGLEDESSRVLKGDRWQIHQHNSPIRNMNDQSFANLSVADAIRIEAVAGDMLHYYSYEPLNKRKRMLKVTLS